MATAATSLLGLALPVTGELSGTWGDTVNLAITALLDTAVAGTTTLSSDADVTLTTTTLAANQARQAIILWNPAAGTVTRNITAPAQSKMYTVINASGGTQSIVFRGVGPTTGVTIVKGESAVVAWNGSDFIKVSNTAGAGVFTNLTVSGTTTLSGLTASTALALDASKNVVSVANTGTGSNVLATSPVLVTPALGTPSALVVTNASGTASININGTVGATTPATGAFTTLSATLNQNAISSITVANSDTTNSSSRARFAATSGTVIGSMSAIATDTLYIGTESNHPLNLFTYGTTRAVVSSTGLAVTGTFSSTLDATIYGLTVGRGAGAVASNTAVGASALAANTSGIQSVAVGTNALAAQTSGIDNVGVGVDSLAQTTTGTNNSAIGTRSLWSNITGSQNTGLGRNALRLNTTGSFNTAQGVDALLSNTTASENTAVGYQAAYSNTTGTPETALGYQSLYTNTTGIRNTSIGYKSLFANTTGSENSTSGHGALLVNTTGSNNTAMGSQSLISNTTASNNTAVGYQAGYANTTGPGGTFIGYQAGLAATTGAYNCFVGLQAGSAVTTGTRNTILGGYGGNSGGLDIRTASNYIVLSDGDGNPLISTNSTRSVALNGAVPQTGTGITFPATQNASSDVNTLDDYEEGTWTPILQAESGTFGAITYNALNGGRYIKVGSVVHVQGILYTDTVAVGTASLEVRVAGLPFTSVASSGSTQNGFSSLAVSASQNWVTNQPTGALVRANSTQMGLTYRTTANGAVSNMPVGEVTTASTGNLIRITGTYVAA